MDHRHLRSVVSSEEKGWKKEKSTEGVDIVIIMF